MAAIINRRVPKDLPTGQISMSQVNVELGHEPNAPISLGQEDVRELAEVPSGQISMSDLQGKQGTTVHRLTVGYYNLFGRFYGYNKSNNYGAINPLTLQGGEPDPSWDLRTVDIGISDFTPTFVTFTAFLQNTAVVPSASIVRMSFPDNPSLAPVNLPSATTGWTVFLSLGLGQEYFDYLRNNNGNIVPVLLEYLPDGT